MYHTYQFCPHPTYGMFPVRIVTEFLHLKYDNTNCECKHTYAVVCADVSGDGERRIDGEVPLDLRTEQWS